MSASRYFEDFNLGETWSSVPTLVSAEEIMAFGRAYDPQPMHTDPEWAASGPFGGLIASGWLIAALAVKVFVQAGGYGATPVVGLGIDELRWHLPVKAGDLITVKREVFDLRRSSSNPTQGIIRTRVSVHNQNGELVMSLLTAGRVPVKPSAAAGERGSLAT